MVTQPTHSAKIHDETMAEIKGRKRCYGNYMARPYNPQQPPSCVYSVLVKQRTTSYKTTAMQSVFTNQTLVEFSPEKMFIPACSNKDLFTLLIYTLIAVARKPVVVHNALLTMQCSSDSLFWQTKECRWFLPYFIDSTSYLSDWISLLYDLSLQFETCAQVP